MEMKYFIISIRISRDYLSYALHNRRLPAYHVATSRGKKGNSESLDLVVSNTITAAAILVCV